ncbi:MAG: hypothetical protein HKN49_11540 [Gammaproteobacteria bacterium]|nr:hypothetical protein [Gammaproteobacteria bacterium]
MTFQTRYNLGRLSLTAIVITVLLLITLADLPVGYLVVAIVVAAIAGWAVTLFALRCPQCEQNVAAKDEEGETPFPLLGDPPQRCDHCDADLL